MTELVKRRLNFRVVAGNSIGGRASCLFLYSDRHPLEVRFVFAGLSKPWALGRDLLADGLNLPAGDGDVYIEPVLSAMWVDVTLSTPSGEATLRFNRDDLLDALDATWQVCEQGHEPIDFDSELESLLKGQVK